MCSQSQRYSPGEPGEVNRRKSLGRAGENVAKLFLTTEGYRVLEINYRRKGGEADLVLLKGNTLVFCEVKTRVNEPDPGGIIESYTGTQQQRLVRVSEIYLAENAHRLPDDYCLRYDLVIVGDDPEGGLRVIEHIPDAFRPD